ncbi:hypothetical protein [Pseudomonas sp. EA_105y_Pfl2_R69]|uniref:hypothetical protein n=1 Tax=Pseudomonas sp. EA_105y_Pfl2_R69 TaxID=3088683 RepID=UPI0030D8AEE9
MMLEDSGQLDWITWGRRKEQQGYEPQGGWAKLSTVQAGGWDKYRPRRGFGMVQRFMEKEGQPGEKGRVSHWFDVPEDCALECLVIGEGEQQRVYVVTTEPPVEYAWIHDRWPLLVELPVASLTVSPTEGLTVRSARRGKGA